MQAKKVKNLEKVVDLLKVHGFVQRKAENGSELVTYQYGPCGVFYLRNILQAWWKCMVTSQENVFPVEGSLAAGSPKSGGLGSDVQTPSNWIRTGMSQDCLDQFYHTAQFVNHRLPFGIAQQGSYWNSNTDSELQSRFMMNSVTNVGLMLQYYCPPSMSTQSFDHWLQFRLKWWRQLAGEPSSFSTTEIQTSDSGNSEVCIHYQFPWGSDTVETITNRGDKDLKERQERLELDHMCRHGRRQVLPHVIECHCILERAFLAYILDGFQEKQKPLTVKDQSDLHRTVLQLHAHLAPYKVALATSGSKQIEVKEVSTFVAMEMRNAGINVLYLQEVNSLENQFSRNDTLGIPFTVVLSDNTLETGIVRIRNRDTTLKEQVHITQLTEKIQLYMK